MIKFIGNQICEISLKDWKVVLQVVDGRVIKIFDGPINEEYQTCESVAEDIHAYYPEIISSYGHIDYRESLVYIEDNNTFFTNRFIFNKWEQIVKQDDTEEFPHSRNKYETLRITYLNEAKTVQIEQFISVYNDEDTLVSNISIKNIGNTPIRIKRAMSLQLDIQDDGYKIMTFTGKWAHERHITNNEINYGTFKNSSICGASSSFNNPATVVYKDNKYYLMNLIYSSNHMELIQTTHNNTTRALIGMNDFMMDIPLEKNQSFTTPEATLTFGLDINMMKLNSNHFIERHILRKIDFPIIFNSWEGLSFGINRDNWKKLAKLASQLGCNIFVFDDGWYGKRNDDTSSLGDFYLYEEKMGTWEEINSCLENYKIGLGIWVEPEMVSPNSELYRSHPEYALETPNIKPVLGRNQLMLDFSNPKVVDHVYSTLKELIEKAHPRYIKWDFNRLVTEVYSLTSKGGNFFYEYEKGLYHLMNKLVSEYPDIIFEGCASGGARFDLGILYYFPVIWTSDCTDAKERIYIQEGTNLVYPMSCISNHVSCIPNQQTGLKSSLEDRINISLFGRYGFELDLVKENKADILTLKKSVEYYLKRKELIINGDTYYSYQNDINIKCWVTVNSDKSEALSYVASLNSPDRLVKFVGLDETTLYSISFRKQTNIEEEVVPPLTGKELMEKGITLSHLFMENDSEVNETKIATRVIRFKKVK